jgi:hypothetical protein
MLCISIPRESTLCQTLPGMAPSKGGDPQW